MKVAGLLTSILVALMAMIGLGVWLLNMAADSSRQAAKARYLAINPGMNRTEVRWLMQGLGTVMYTGIESAELMHIDGRYMISVVYQPDPKDPSPTIYPDRVPHDSWVVKEKLFLELGRGGAVDDALVGLNLRSQRSAERARMPK